MDSIKCSALLVQEYYVKTGTGPVSVAVFGDRDKPALVTYPDLALNCKPYNRSFLFCIVLYAAY